VGGVDLGDLDDETFAEIERAHLDYKVVFFRDQQIDARAQIAFGRRFGELEEHVGAAGKSAVGAYQIVLQLLERFIVLGLADLPIQLPSIQLRSVRTSCTLPDGGTLLLSGLMSDYRFEANSGIPLLSDLPIIGRLFGTDLRQREKSNLLIMVTARLILFTEEEARL